MAMPGNPKLPPKYPKQKIPRHLLSQFNPEDQSQFFILSFIFHVGLIGFALLNTLFFPGKPHILLPTLRVDLVDLPDVLKGAQKQKAAANIAPPASSEIKQSAKPEKPPKPEVKPIVKNNAKPEKEMVFKPKPAVHNNSKINEKKLEKKLENNLENNLENKMKSSLARLKSIEKITEERAAEEQQENVKPNKETGSLVRGNKLSKGLSTSPEAREAAEASYYDALKDRLQENWTLPVWVARQNLAAQVRVFIDSRGHLRGFQITKSSGNVQFDDAVKFTLKASQPYPIPPAELVAGFVSQGVLVGFPL